MARLNKNIEDGLNVSADYDGNGTYADSVGDYRGKSPLEIFEIKEGGEKIRAAVKILPEDSRQVISLAYFQGLKYREITERLGIPIGTVKSKLHHAKSLLKELVAKPYVVLCPEFNFKTEIL